MKKSLTLRLLYLTLALINVFGLLCNATASVGKVNDEGISSRTGRLLML